MRKKKKQNMNGGTPMNTRPVAIIKNLPPHLAQRLAERQAARLQRQTEAAIEQVKRKDVSATATTTTRGAGAPATRGRGVLTLPEPGTCCVCLGAIKPNLIRLKGGDVVEAYCPTQVTRMGSLLLRHADEECSPGGTLYQANLPRLRAFAALAQAEIDQDLPVALALEPLPPGPDQG